MKRFCCRIMLAGLILNAAWFTAGADPMTDYRPPAALGPLDNPLK